uniref:glycosyltransferase family 2 protein n=1 Tax=Butyrivibrio sp. TaxID=28121 RepID=UPI0025EB79A3
MADESNAKYNDLISVIIPVYNDKRFLPECLQSLHNQIHSNLQIILIDDGSTDKTSS